MIREDGFEAQSNFDPNQTLIPPINCIILVKTFIPYKSQLLHM